MQPLSHCGFCNRRSGKLLATCRLREVREPPEYCRVSGERSRRRVTAGSLRLSSATPPILPAMLTIKPSHVAGRPRLLAHTVTGAHTLGS